MRRHCNVFVGLTAVAMVIAASPLSAQIIGPYVIQEESLGETRPLSELAADFHAGASRYFMEPKFEIPNQEIDLRELTGKTAMLKSLLVTAGEEARQTIDGTNGTTPFPTLSFEGTSDDDNAALLGYRLVPPDTEGDVGHKYYTQMNNVVFEIFDKKTGESVLGPLPNNIFFAGTGSVCELTNDGDPVVLYDQQARRWIFSQFALPIYSGLGIDGHQCIAVSKTQDPFGEYYLYDFVTAVPEFGGVFAINDYPKMGVWTDGIYYTANDFQCLLTSPTTCSFFFTNVSAVAFDKEAMYAGDTAVGIKFQIGPIGVTDEIFIGVQPSHWAGDIKPKKGEPNTFWQLFDTEEFTFSGSTDQDGIWHWDFFADFDDPMSSTFVDRGLIEFPEYLAFACDGAIISGRNCVDQPSPGTVLEGQGLDSIDYRTMFRSQYRNFGEYAAVVLSATVDADGEVNGSLEAGIRWAEVRKGGKSREWELHQAGTYAPEDGENRFMPSIAQNKKGEIALGYTVSSTTTYPSVRYTTRRADDALGEMTGGEVSCFEGSGSQIDSFWRWGDYSSMSVDPQSDCTFWYTNQYYEEDTLFDFKTRICSFNTCAESE
jgi:hypothetical protein